MKKKRVQLPALFHCSGRIKMSLVQKILLFYFFLFVFKALQCTINEPPHEKTSDLQMQKQRRRSASW